MTTNKVDEVISPSDSKDESIIPIAINEKEDETMK